MRTTPPTKSWMAFHLRWESAVPPIPPRGQPKGTKPGTARRRRANRHETSEKREHEDERSEKAMPLHGTSSKSPRERRPNTRAISRLPRLRTGTGARSEAGRFS